MLKIRAFAIGTIITMLGCSVSLAEPVTDNTVVNEQGSDFNPNSLCSSPQLLAKTIETIGQYTAQNGAENTLAKRQKALLTSNLKSLHRVNAADFSPKTDFNTANALIMIKINEKIPENDIVICQQDGKHNPPLFLIGYPLDKQYRFYIINLNKNNDNYKEFSFIFP